MADKTSPIEAMIPGASEIAGSLAAAGLGMLVAGPPGALGGAVLGPIVTRVISRTCIEVYGRVSGRGGARATAAASYAIAEIGQRVSAGEAVRDDSFFQTPGARSPADEILEGVMLKCRDAHEERKAPYYGYLFATAAFEPMYSQSYLNRALTVLDSLTYQQLCILRIISTAGERGLRKTDYVESEGSTALATINVLDELFDLLHRGLAHRHVSDTDESESSIFVMDPFQIAPSEMRLTKLGKQFVSLIRLERLPEADASAVATLIQ